MPHVTNITADRNGVAAGHIDTVVQTPPSVYETMGRDTYLARAQSVSTTRLETRRRGAGLSPDQLQRSLTQRPTVPPALDTEFSAGSFLVLTGPLGAGKSDIAEWFRGLLARPTEDSTTPIPVWVDTRELTLPLEAELIAELGLHVINSVGCDVVVDGLDERAERAPEILMQAGKFINRWPKSRVLLTSREAPVQLLKSSFGKEVQIAATPLARHEADQLMRAVAGTDVTALSPQLEEALGRPLFAILIARHASAVEGVTGIPELIDLVVHDVVAAEGYDLYAQLRRLAVESIRTGKPVDPASFTTTDVAARIRNSPLVMSEGPRCSFALATFEQWFAAKALLEEEVDTADLLTSMGSFDRWKYIFAIVLAAGDANHADQIMAAVARWNPGAASWVIKETHSGGLTRSRPEITGDDWEHVGRRLRLATSAWLEGVGPPLSEAFWPFRGMSSADFGHVSVAVGLGNSHQLAVAWLPSHQPPQPRLPPIVREEELRGCAICDRQRALPTGTNWVWEWTKDDLADDFGECFLDIALRTGENLPGVVRDEKRDLLAAWQARDAAAADPSGEVSWKLENPLYPYPDIPPTFQNRWGAWEVETMHQRVTAILSAAMKCYLELSAAIAPNFGITLAHRGLMPVEFFGTMQYDPHGPRGPFEWGPREPGLRYVLKPLGILPKHGDVAAGNRVSLTANDDGRFGEIMRDRDSLYAEFRSYVQSRPEYAPFAGAFTITHGRIDAVDVRPATRMALGRLWKDLEQLGWVNGMVPNMDCLSRVR